MYVKDWHRFQHYKDRNPPWVKLHRSLLDDPEYHELSPEAAKVLPLIWLAASEYSTDGSLPDIKRLAFRLHYASNALSDIIKQLNHWIILEDSEALASCESVAIPETETKTETKTDFERAHARGTCTYSKEFEDFRAQYPKHRHGGKQQDWASWQVAKKKGMTVEKANEYLAHWKKCPKWQKNGGEFIVAISKWLRGGFWEDMPPTATQPKSLNILMTA